MKQFNFRVIEEEDSVSIINMDRQEIKSGTLEDLISTYEKLGERTQKPIAVSFAKSENMTIEQMVSEGMKVLF
ncbi:hypothetical protein AB1K09_20075 [Solibacillus silvestris]